MDKKKITVGSVVLGLLMFVAWLMGWLGGADPALAKLQDLGNQMADQNLPAGERDALRDQFRDQMRSLTDDQRRAFFDGNRGQWQQRSQQRMDEFFALSKPEQKKKLDDMLGRMNQPGNNQRPDRGRGDAKGGGGGGGRGTGKSEAQREERSKRRLDGSSPKMRAQMAEFHKMLNQRAQERGIPLNNTPWLRGFGGNA